VAFPHSCQALILGTGECLTPSPWPQGSGFLFEFMNLPACSFLRLDKNANVIVDIHVIPNAARTQADGTHDGALRVRLHAPPVDGKANAALCAWLAEQLGIAKNQVQLLRGQTSKRKQLSVNADTCQRANWQSLLA
jgi:uncharacterized protein